jgi:light-regulated signal transduction histidine kinase (bacteriophytochrome)
MNEDALKSESHERNQRNAENGAPDQRSLPTPDMAAPVYDSGYAMPTVGVNADSIGVWAAGHEATIKVFNRKIEALQGVVENLQCENAQLRKTDDGNEAFLSIHGHDLNAGLRNIRCSAQRILARSRFASDPLIHEACTWILDGVCRIEAINNSAKLCLRATDAAQKDETVDLEGAARDAISILKEKYEACGGEITLGPLPQVKGCSRTLLTVVFQNLFDNPLKYGRPGVSPKIEVNGTSTEFGLGVISIADNGVGIDPALAGQIFEKFKRGFNVAPAGDGLGLFNVHNVITRSGGKVWVENNGSGSTFFFSLPLAQPNLTSSATTESDSATRPLPKEPGKAADDAEAAAA